jgi:hypothetical protein
MTVSCGIDWSEDHHDVAVVDPTGQLLAKQRSSDDAAGRGRLLGLLAETGDRPQQPIPVATQTARGCWWPACAPAAGRWLPATRWRWPATGSATPSRASRSDHADALVLAKILRTDLAPHRPLPADSELVRAIAGWPAPSRIQQDAVWDRTQAHNKLRSLLREQLPRVPGSIPHQPRWHPAGARPARCWRPHPPRRTRPD